MIKNERILEINNLNVNINNKPIINNLSLSIEKGEIHAIMGKNGSGKSTLAKVIAGHPHYEVTQGNIILKNNNITHKEPDFRSHQGIFLAFQYPVEVPGVSNIDFLRLAYNSKQKAYNKKEADPLTFFDLINKKLNDIEMDKKFLDRHLNEGFSGGEKKKNEILQMSLLNSELSILDEIDSGLDIDALKKIADNIKYFSNENNGIILITHYKRLIDYIKPNYIHVMHEGQIIYTGDNSTATNIEKYGYEHILNNIKI
uniref:Iron-sulfur cluster formation ABC transporterATP-binding subunit n=1 Tax=Ophidocladus simpliciusculus TaxID=1261574 RepID=A0A1Z1MIV5_9FLOR|nr:Iron-sulfur cluster formation ABC transporterATP-binding subunit [Ophidocladus simpliciusculus]ARW65983.1 Iron-sulfur cluster formation ABC transporterATP-binding subunit [Ophidocladus simpliciusculus]